MPVVENVVSPHGEVACAISNLVVRLVSAYTGRGPTKARSYLNEDLVTVVLQHSLTKGEVSLARAGKDDLVLSGRQAFQQTMSAQLIAGVEELTGRKVEAFLSANHIEPDVAVETFLLGGPVGGELANGAGPPDR